MGAPRLLTLYVFTLVAWLDFSSAVVRVFLACSDGIFACEDFSDQKVNHFTKIVSTSSVVFGLSHLSNPMKLIYTEGYTGIYQCDLDGSNQEPILEGLSDPVGITVYDDKCIYWAERGDHAIKSCNIDGSDSKSIVTSTTHPFQVTSDSRRIYWGQQLDPGSATSVKFDGSGAKNEMDGLTLPMAVAVDEKESKLYVAEHSHISGQIKRKDFDKNIGITLYAKGESIVDMAILNDVLLFAEQPVGLKAIPKNASGPVDAVVVNTTGFDPSRGIYNIHIIEEETGYTTSQQTSTADQTTHVTTKGKETTLHLTTDAQQALTTDQSTHVTTEQQKETTRYLTTTVQSSSTDPAAETSSDVVHKTQHVTTNVHSSSADPVTDVADTTQHVTTNVHSSSADQATDTRIDVVDTNQHLTTHFQSSSQTTNIASESIVTTQYETTNKVTDATIGQTSDATTQADLISKFETDSNILPSDDKLYQKENYAKQRFTIMKNETIDKQLVVDKYSYNVKIETSTSKQYEDIGFLVIAAMALTNASKQGLFESKTSAVTFELATNVVSINAFSSKGNKVKVSNENYLVTFQIRFDLLELNVVGSSKSPELVCGFWKERKYWSTEGVRVSKSETNDSQLTCLANHLTTFAGLFRLTQPHTYSKVIKVITSIGTGASIIALMIGIFALGILLNSSNLNNCRLLVHVNLMIAMLLAYICLMISGEARANYYFCFAITILLLYNFLSVFSWTSIEAIHLFRMIVIVYGSERDLKWLYMAIGWGIPLLITGIICAIGREQLIDENATNCWLVGKYIWAFIGPVVFILLGNAIILGIVIKKTISAAAVNENIQSVKTGLRSMILLLPMLGVAWLIGLAVNAHISIDYMFNILSSIQGVYLVIVVCAISSEIREGLKRQWRKHNDVVDVALAPMRDKSRRNDVTEEMALEDLE